MKIIRYNNEYKRLWNSKVKSSKNATFLFEREFVEYHKERFNDYSLLIFDKDELLACFIASATNSEAIVSHGGLTYGGLIYEKNLRTTRVKEIIVEIVKYYSTLGFKEIIWKIIPSFYCNYPSDEIIYLLSYLDFELYRIDQTTLIDVSLRPKLNRGRKRWLSKAKKEGVYVKESKNFSEFFEDYKEHLKMKYGTQPVHTGEELELLNSRFPENVQLISAFIDREFIGGIIGFIADKVFHAQYIHFTERGKESGGADMVIEQILSTMEIRYFDFGISTEDDGKYLNDGLLNFKESYGGRGAVHIFFSKKL